MSTVTVVPQVVTPARITVELSVPEAEYILVALCDIRNHTNVNLNDLRNGLVKALNGSKEPRPIMQVRVQTGIPYMKDGAQ